VLDWGCGGGHFSFSLVESGYEVEGYNLFPEEGYLPYLQTRPNFHLTLGSPDDPRSLPFADESFDTVFSIGVLEHVRETGGDEVASMKEIRRVLRVGGTFICVHFPNRNSLVEWGARKRKVFHHDYLYTKNDIVELCKGADMTLLESGLYNVLPRRVLNKLPGRDSNAFVAAYNALDWALWTVGRQVAQNWAFVARKDT
jgi:SAM-dependent methyltransferase